MFINYILPLIVGIIFVVLFVVLCTIKFKNADENKKLLPVRIIFYLLVIFEIAKIVYLIHQNGKYEPSRYPIVFCSIVMFAYPLFCFKQNKFSDFAKTMSVMPSIFVYILFAAIQWQFNLSIIQAHSYFYHSAMLAVAIYLLTVKLYKFEFKKFFDLFLGLAGYVLFSTVLSLFLGGDISYFGPNSSYLAFLYNMFGYAVGNILLCILFFVLCVLFYGIIALCQKRKSKPQKTLEITQKEETKNV